MHLRDIVEATVTDDGDVSGRYQLGDSTVGFRGTLPLLWIGQLWEEGSGEDIVALWELCDGYGYPGAQAGPGQEFDWSGIRDSSAGAIAAMTRFAQQLVPAEDVAAWLRLPTDRLLAATDAALEGLRVRQGMPDAEAVSSPYRVELPPTD